VNESFKNNFAEEIKCWKNLTYIGDEKIDDIDCYKIEVIQDLECWKNTNKDLFGEEIGSLNIVEVKNFTYYIEKNTYKIKMEKFKMRIKEENLGDINFEIDFRFKDYDKTFIELEFPEEIKV
ncbi:MAG: hypothetical protein ACK4YO_03550, partial [Candidatus Altarchaeaceae archaeon]